MKECWINVYRWWDDYNFKYQMILGAYKFWSKEDAISYNPSFGLSVAYRIHVRMK